jgi:hypothetical protein
MSLCPSIVSVPPRCGVPEPEPLPDPDPVLTVPELHPATNMAVAAIAAPTACKRRRMHPPGSLATRRRDAGQGYYVTCQTGVKINPALPVNARLIRNNPVS